jgi:putative membrane protein
VASIFVVARSITRWTAGTLLIFIIGAVLAWYITGLPPTANTSGLAFLFLSGALAICAMILPGISGAFILVLLGSYKTVLDAVHERDMLVICTVALGAVFGLLSFSRLLKWMFSRYNNITLALLTGFILGSLKKIWPWKVVLETRNYGEKIIAVQEENVWPWRYNGDPQIIYAIVLVILGFSLIFMLEKLATKK